MHKIRLNFHQNFMAHEFHLLANLKTALGRVASLQGKLFSLTSHTEKWFFSL